MLGNLYHTLYGKPEEGHMKNLYSHHGSPARYQRMDVRTGLSNTETNLWSFFEREIEGIPIWIIGLFLLGLSSAKKMKQVKS